GRDQTLFCSLLQQLWRSRNLLVFEGKDLIIEEEIEKARKVCDEFLNSQVLEKEIRQSMSPTNQIKSFWEGPPTDSVKINVDAVTGQQSNGGVGIVARDEEGQILATAVWTIPFHLQAHQAEAYSIDLGLSLARDCCSMKVVIESDCLDV
ncbi:hypothetical protein PIB30_071537, partial [Stylosanthes scabra]|nr:hypothetical protein [Stylosanthes scabra]